jgi:hypothetical protein
MNGTILYAAIIKTHKNFKVTKMENYYLVHTAHFQITQLIFNKHIFAKLAVVRIFRYITKMFNFILMNLGSIIRQSMKIKQRIFISENVKKNNLNVSRAKTMII